MKSQYQEQKLLAEIERFVGHDLSKQQEGRHTIRQTNGSLQVFNAWSVMERCYVGTSRSIQNKWNWDNRAIVWHIVNCYSLSFWCWWRGHPPRSSSSGIHVFWDGKTEGPPIVVLAEEKYCSRERDRRKLGRKDDMESLRYVISSLIWLRMFEDFSCVHCAGLQCYSRWIL